MTAAVERKSLAETLSSQLSDAILRGEFGENGRIGTKDELQARLGVARGTINEIVRLLSSRKVIQMRPGPKGGLFANSTPAVKFGELVLRLQNSASNASECLEIKDALDPIAAMHAARTRTADDIERLRSTLREYEASRDPRARVVLNWKLHRQISELSDNRLLVVFYGTVMDMLEAELVEVSPPQEALEIKRIAKRNAVHRDLVEAIAAGDAARAGQLGGAEHKFDIRPIAAPPRRSDR